MFDWKNYLTLASLMYAVSHIRIMSECLQRSSVGRAYYCVYNEWSIEAINKFGFVPKKNSKDHGRLRQVLKKKGLIMVAQELDELRKWRNECDYNDHVANVKILNKNALFKARKLLSYIT